MSAYVIWIDSAEAKVFKLKAGGMETKHIHTHGHKHHSDPHGHSSNHHPLREQLFKDVETHVSDATEILIMGPGEAKTLFKHHLEKHRPHDLAKKVVGMETTDHPTENQVLAQARKFFKSSDLFR
jgi:stalled ribosome rescue protein Dom34